MDYFTLLTQTGTTKITAAAANNTTVNLTHIAVGDGAGSVMMPNASQTTLVGETYRTLLTNLKVDDNNSNWLVAVGYIPSDVGNFWVREVGIFDEDGDLIALGNYPETFKPVMANNVAKDLYISVIMETSNAEAVTLEIDPSIVMASRAFVEQNFSNKQHKHNEEYAALNGSELQRFRVADAEEDDEAVTRSQMYAKYSGLKNYIINGGFDIWQDGTSFTTSGYTADMWSFTYPDLVTKEANGTMKVVGTDPSSRFQQRVEGDYLCGKTVTLSFANNDTDVSRGIRYTVTGGSYTTVLAHYSHTNSDGFRVFSATFTFPEKADGGFVIIEVYNTQKTIQWQYVQLEEGTIATPFEKRPYALELMLCQRYFEKCLQDYTMTLHTTGGTAFSAACNATYPFKVVKRVTPTITRATLTNGTGLTVQASPTHVRFSATATSSNPTITAGFTADARL